MKFDYEKFEKWENEIHIPQAVMDIVNAVAEKIGCTPVEEETIEIQNRVGEVIGYAKGFSLTHCTSSYETGPTPDYSMAMSKWLKGLGFSIENSYGNNGMDSSSNWHDTHWTHEFTYKPTQVWEESFIIWEDGDYEE